MEELIWTEEYSVGVKALDAQHKQIIHAINKLVRHPDDPVNSETVSDVLSEITQFASEHFRFEEQMLEEIEYPYLEDQKEHHREFRLKIIEFCNATMVQVDEVPVILLEYLTEWWYNHIHHEDMIYKTYFAAKGIQ